MKVGIISFAHMHAYSYAKALNENPEVELVGITDENQKRGLEAAKTYHTAFFPSSEALLSEGLDAVVVTSENARHHRDVLKACEYGVHILCEKPLAISVQECREMIEACEKRGVILQVAFPVRFNTAVAHAKELIDRGEIGEILAIRGTNRGTNPGDWFVVKEKSGGGAVIDHTVHLVDIIRWFTGSEIVEVYAEADRLFSDIETEDAGIVTIELANGVFATIDCSWSRNRTYPTWGDVGLEIIGSKGTLSVEAFAQKLDVYSNHTGVKWNYWGDDMDASLINDFIEAVKTERAPSVTGIDGLKSVEAVEAAYASIKAHQPIRLSDGKEIRS
jgi:predicted dehydrogenase